MMGNNKSGKDGIVVAGKVLDNVHGFIEYTETEERIMHTLLFKRLQSIKQLSIVNWVFPGSEHTRYIHSLGVMYIADKIAVQLNLPIKDRKIVRLAGLLHDIGHYPLSHVCEHPYRYGLEAFPEKDFCKSFNEKVKKDIDDLKDDLSYKYMKKSSGNHHEQIGADIVLNNSEIRELIIQECGKDAPQIIADMITGNVERTDPLLVQILHSELDADGIDYLMRDAMFSGTSFGTFELDLLIRCMCIGEYEGQRILCINEKGIAAADQYLINKFFSYTQVVCNKHVSITEWMAEQIVYWMSINNQQFPKASLLKKWVAKEEASESFLGFTDSKYWASLQIIATDDLTDNEFIETLSKKLLHHSELCYDEGSEIKKISNSYEEIKQKIKESTSYENLNDENKISIILKRDLSKQIPQKEFTKLIEEKIQEEKKEGSESATEEQRKIYEQRLYMECICVKDEDGIHLLCDDERSLMQTLHSRKLVVFRTYIYDKE